MATAKKLGCIAGVLLLALLAGGGAYLYFGVLAPGPRAHRHVPLGSNVVIRVDGVAIATFKPVRQHIWPLLLEPSATELETSKRLDRLAEHTGVRLPGDVREVVIASLDAEQWVALAGGNIEPGRFVAGLERVLQEEGLGGWRRNGELLVHESGAAVGQADDGTLVLGTGIDVARVALPESDADAELPVATDQALSFYVNRSAYRGGVSQLPLGVPGLDSLDRIDHLEGTFVLSEEPRLTMHAFPRDGVAADALAAELSSALGKIKLMSLLLPDDGFGAKEALANAKVSADGSRVRLETPWSYAALERATVVLAQLIQLGRPPEKRRPALPAP